MKKQDSVRSRRRTQAITLAMSVAGAVGFAGAQTTRPPVVSQAEDGDVAERALAEVTVTARRRAEDAQDVPLTVSVFSAEAIQRAGIRSLSDVAKYTPGLVIDLGFTLQDVRPNIRGLPATSGRPPTGILVDGVDVSTESISTAGGGNLMNLRLLDFERIEVVKGPQSALYGRVAFGGAVNYVTREPSDEFGGNVNLDVAEGGLTLAQGGVNLPVSDRLALRLNAAYAQFDGFYRNSLSGAKLGGYESNGGSISARLKAGEDSKIVARVSMSSDQNDVRPQYYLGSLNGLGAAVPLPSNAVGQRIGPSTALSTLPATQNQYRPGVIEAGPSIALSLDPATGEDYPGTDSDTVIGTVRAEFPLSWATLESWTGVVDSHDRTIQDASFNGYPLRSVARPAPGGLGALGPNGSSGFFQLDLENDLRQYSQEVRLGDLESKGMRWAAGALYWYEDVEQIRRSVSAFATQPGVSQYLNAALQGGRVDLRPLAGRTTTHYSAYGVFEYDLTDRLSATAEARFGREKYDYVFAQSVGLGGTGITAVAPFVLVGAAGQASVTTDYFAPRLGLDFKLSSDALVYVSAAKGVKPGGISQGPVAAPEIGKFEPEELWNYELGAKTTWNDGRVLLNASYFRMDYRDKQVFAAIPVPLTVSPTATLSLTTNAGKAQVDGIELELGWAPIRNVNLSVGYTYLDTEYTDYVINSQSVLQIASVGNCTIVTTLNNVWCQISRTGNELEQAPRHMLTANALVRMPAFRDWDYVGDVSAQYRGRRFQEDANQFIFDAYWNVDLRLGVENDRYSAFVYVTNLTDDRTIRSAQQSGDVWAGFPVQLQLAAFAPDPRQLGLRVQARF